MPKAPGAGRVGRAKGRGNLEDLPEEGRAGKVSSDHPVVAHPEDSTVLGVGAGLEGVGLQG